MFPNGDGEGLDLQGNPYKRGPNNETRTRLIDTWGTSSEDTHFVVFADGAGGVHNDFNTAHYDSTFLSYAIGDMEELSGSLHPTTLEFQIDFTDENNFVNRLIIDKGKGYTYKTYVGVGAGSNGAPVDGRPMGRTAYFSASQDGTIYYPANHYVNFPTSKEGIYNLTYGGTLNGASVKVVKDEISGDLVDTILDVDDPLYLVRGIEFINKGWDHDTNQAISASSMCVYVNKVGGSDTDNVLKVIRNR